MPRPSDLPILNKKHVDPFVLYPLYADCRAFDNMEEFGLYESGKKVTDEPEILFARMKMDDLVAMVEGDLEE